MKNHVFMLLFWLLPGTAAFADQSDPRLDDLFAQLKQAGDASAAVRLETQIWQIWIEHDNPDYYQLMLTGIAQMNRNSLPAALITFNRLTALAPDYAEAWNKRATIHYLLQNYQASEEDIAKTLALEPFHFGALSGLGLVHLARRQFDLARSAFHAALEVSPQMPGVKQNLEAINDFFRDRSI
jgi:Flp pilus assembly protein TadD